jgi:hypothetical protein
MGASDLAPEVNRHGDMKVNLRHLSAFVASVDLIRFKGDGSPAG